VNQGTTDTCGAFFLIYVSFVLIRKISYGIGVEKVFPIHSPLIEGIKVVKQGVVRRAKLYYLRDKKGKAAKVKERTYSRK